MNTKTFIKLARSRLTHALFKRVWPCKDEHGFVINTPEKLFTYWGLFIEGQSVDKEWTEALRKEFRPYVVDVGAHAGIFSHYVLGINKSADILAIEPQPELVRELRLMPIKVSNCACSSRSGAMWLARANPGDVRARINHHGLPVFAEPLDGLVERPVFLLKIDAEGHDREVLKGATETLKRTRFIIIECHGNQAIRETQEILQPLGFFGRPVGIYDWLFTRRDLI